MSFTAQYIMLLLLSRLPKKLKYQKLLFYISLSVCTDVPPYYIYQSWTK